MNYLFHPNQKHQELGILKITRIINSNTSTVVRYGRQSSLLPNITLSLPCGTFFSFLALGMISIITKTVTAEVYRFFTPPQNKLARNFWPRAHTTNLSVSSRILSRTAYLFFIFSKRENTSSACVPIAASTLWFFSLALCTSSW